MGNSMEDPQKARVAMWSSNPTPEHISQGNWNSKRYMHPYVHSCTIHNSQDTEKPKCPLTDEWIKNDYIYNGILLSHKKEWNNAILKQHEQT